MWSLDPFKFYYCFISTSFVAEALGGFDDNPIAPLHTLTSEPTLKS